MDMCKCVIEEGVETTAKKPKIAELQKQVVVDSDDWQRYEMHGT